MNPSTVLPWMQECLAYWQRERQLADLVLEQEYTTSEIARAEQQVRKRLATQIIRQLENLQREMDHGTP